jgi:hypothetical protein
MKDEKDFPHGQLQISTSFLLLCFTLIKRRVKLPTMP